MSTTKAAATPAKTAVTVKGRFSYVHVFEPTAMEGSDKKKYSVSLIISKSDTATIAIIKAAIEQAKADGLTSKFGGKIPVSGFKIPLRDGDAERPDSPEYKNSYFLNASSNNKPGIVDIAKEPILDTTEFYSGCHGRANVNFYPFNTNGSKGIACGLNHVQKLDEGEALGGRVSIDDAFDDADLSA